MHWCTFEAVVAEILDRLESESTEMLVAVLTDTSLWRDEVSCLHKSQNRVLTKLKCMHHMRIWATKFVSVYANCQVTGFHS